MLLRLPGRQVIRQPVEHLGVRQLASGGLAVEVRALRLAEPDDLLLPRQQVIQLTRLAGEELLVVRVGRLTIATNPGTDHRGEAGRSGMLKE
jgi:hypothetical protein